MSMKEVLVAVEHCLRNELLGLELHCNLRQMRIERCDTHGASTGAGAAPSIYQSHRLHPTDCHCWAPRYLVQQAIDH